MLPSPHIRGTSNRAANSTTSTDGEPASETKSGLGLIAGEHEIRKGKINAYQNHKVECIAQKCGDTVTVEYNVFGDFGCERSYCIGDPKLIDLLRAEIREGHELTFLATCD